MADYSLVFYDISNFTYTGSPTPFPDSEDPSFNAVIFAQTISWDGTAHENITITDDDSVLSDNADSSQQVLTQDFTADGVTLTAGTTIDTNYAYEIQIQPSGARFKIYAVVDSSNDNILGFVSEQELTAGEDYRVMKAEGGSFNNAPYASLATCFTPGTLILTDRGEVAIETLRAGDLVETQDSGLQPIRWIGARSLSAIELMRRPQLRPVRIRAGALGGGMPLEDLTVSPHHRVLVRSSIAQRLFGTAEVLISAKQLLSLEGVDIVDNSEGVTYIHMLFDDHQVVTSNGAPSESLYTGPMALRSFPEETLEEIFEIFPELRDRDPAHRPEGARRLLTGQEGRNLAERHREHARPLLS